MPITHGAVRRASGAGPGWASFQTVVVYLCHDEKEIEAEKKIRQKLERQEIRDKRDMRTTWAQKNKFTIKRLGRRCRK